MTQRFTFLITGATKGIGFATAQRLSRLGHHIVGIARNEPVEFPGKIYCCDLLDEEATSETFKKINDNHQIDGVVNNVGIAFRAPFDKVQLKEFKTVLDLNLRPVIQAQIFTQGMIKRKFGRFVNISSRAALGVHNATSYATAKAGLIALTRTWALELAETGITVNAVAPGPTDTERFRQMKPKGSDAELLSLKTVPMNRFACPDEIAAAVSFFLSKDSSFITGQTLYVDGGASIGKQLF